MKRIRPFMQSPHFSRILDASAVLMMSINKSVNEAHYYDPILEASQEHLGDKVMEKMASPWKHSSLSPKRKKHTVSERAFVLMGERESRVHPDIQLDTFVHHLQCEIFAPYIARCKDAQKANSSPGREARDACFM